MLLNKVDNLFSSPVYFFGFDFHNAAFEYWFHLVSIREHDISIENAFPPIFGHWKLIVSWAFIFLFRLLNEGWKALRIGSFRMFVLSMLLLLNTFNRHFENSFANFTAHISLSSIHFLEHFSVSNDTFLSIGVLLSSLLRFVT
jgi:hypothetical protein